jgi:hypothetical protein
MLLQKLLLIAESISDVKEGPCFSPLAAEFETEILQQSLLKTYIFYEPNKNR